MKVYVQGWKQPFPLRGARPICPEKNNMYFDSASVFLSGVKSLYKGRLSLHKSNSVCVLHFFIIK
jgi:hypothetical protein